MQDQNSDFYLHLFFKYVLKGFNKNNHPENSGWKTARCKTLSPEGIESEQNAIIDKTKFPPEPATSKMKPAIHSIQKYSSFSSTIFVSDSFKLLNLAA